MLLGGEPGIGKSTLLLQAAAHFAQHVGPVLYCSGEESEHQIKLRGERLGVGGAPLYLLAETCVERVLEESDRLKPALLIVDSIQTVFSLKMPSAPGSVGQVRQAATRFSLHRQGAEHLPIVLVGHVTKDGSLAGPEGARARRRHRALLRRRAASRASHRARGEEPIRRGQRTRCLRDDRDGLARRAQSRRSCFSPSGRRTCPGSSVLCSIEGSRPILVEVQALVSTSTFGNARRTASGLDQNRLSLLLAVLDKRAGLNLSTDDVFVNVAGGMTVDEPAADLAIVAAVASSLRNRPIHADAACSAKSGWRAKCGRRRRRRCACARRPSWDSRAASCLRETSPRRRPPGIEVVAVRTVGEALDALM